MTTLIAEDLSLLLLDDDKGNLRHATHLDTAIGGALLVELALGGHVEVEGQKQRWGMGAGALIRSTGAMDLAHQVLDRRGRSADEVKARAKEVAEGDFAAKAVADAIASAQAAITAAMVATTVVTTSGS